MFGHSCILILTHLSPCASLIHSIATRVIKLAHAKSSIALAPALVETYSRLLVYMEIESLGIKGFISKFTRVDKLVKKVNVCSGDSWVPH